MHPDERKLISDKAHQMALDQAKNPDDVAKIEEYWTNVLTMVADADVDSQAGQQLRSQLNQMAQAAQASGNTQAYQQFVQAIQTAQQAIQGMAGQTITSNGGPIVADDGLLKTFQATGSQFKDSSLFGTPGGTRLGLAIGETPASVGIGSQYYIAPNGPTNQQINGFANDVLQQIGTANGSVTPVYPLENVVLGGAGGKIVSGVLGKLFGEAADGAAQTAFNGPANPISDAGPATNASGDLNAAGNAARNQPFGNGASASPSPGTNAAGNSGAGVGVPSVTGGAGSRSFVAPSGATVDLPPSASMNNVDVRNWYLAQEAKIPDLIDSSAPLEDQAYQAWSLRNTLRTAARDAMSNQEAAAQLNSQRPNMTWDQTVRKYSSQYSGDDLWNQIIGASQRSNASVNQSLGVVPPGRKP